MSATLKVGSVILAESTLSYLGFGIQPPTASWGNMLQDAQNFSIMVQAWWYPLFPGLFILLTVLCFNFLGDGLRDALDPKKAEVKFKKGSAFPERKKDMKLIILSLKF
ncbi:hypothetical protein BsIDN1_21090 [Bacillus safensis]|uniref:ABC transmembrane type-1 domain-containing protein n=1 Tax=Bacillus safensis TaxID=561879 RepID=A0A5S9M6D1_BACIA|nr:hypothetical protein BsIDN1_21090 [Bacillus safensis]